MTLELNTEHSTDRVAFFAGDVESLARKGKFRPRGAFLKDGKDWDLFGFDIEPTAEFLRGQGILHDAGKTLTSYPLREGGHPSYDGLQFRLVPECGSLTGRVISPNYHEPVAMDRLRSAHAGAIVIECRAVIRGKEFGRERWYRAEPSAPEKGEERYLHVSLYHALADDEMEKSLGVPRDHGIVSSVLSDLKFLVTGRADPVYLCSGGSHLEIMHAREASVHMTRGAAGQLEWAVDHFGRTLGNMLACPDGAALLKVYAHLKTFGDHRYEPRIHLLKDGAQAQGAVPAVMPFERDEVMAVLTRSHYQPPLERLADRARKDKDMTRLLEMI